MHARIAWKFTWMFAFAVAAAAMGGACGAGQVGGGLTSSAGQGGSGETGNGSGGGLFSTGSMSSGGFEIDPKAVTIDVINGVSMPVAFTAKLGGQAVFPESWYVDRADVAGVDGKGVLTPTNKKGALVQVFAKYNGQIAEAQATVNFKKTEGNAPADVQSKLDAASGQDGAIQWAYPYDETVWPRGLLAPELMWNGGGTGDSYVVHFTGNFLDVKIYTAAPPPADVQLSQDDWVAISETGNGNKVEVKVARLPQGAPSAAVVVDHHWEMAKGSMRGSVYYWVNSIGRVVRLKPGEAAPVDFLGQAGVNGCSTCHAVSANGHTIIIGGDEGKASTFDLLNNQPVFSLGGYPTSRRWAQPAISPDGKFLVENNDQQIPGPPGGDDGMFFAANGQKVPNSGLDGAGLWMPAFAPQGHKLAYVSTDGGHDLSAYDFDLANGHASNPHLLVTAANPDPNLTTINFPSVSPTIKSGENDIGKTWIVYHRGSTSSFDTRSGPGDLYMASADMPGVEMRLGHADGDGYPFAAGGRDLHLNFEPTFAPQPSGGYMWVVFTSRRTYGNKLLGDRSQVKQLWVTAIDLHPDGKSDPSHPAFWVRGQDPTKLNMRAYWALDPCIQQGDTCQKDSDCCDGQPCVMGKCGGPTACAQVGQFCEKDADCCDPMAKCVDNSCSYPGPQ